jgi:hypothetical protein
LLEPPALILDNKTNIHPNQIKKETLIHHTPLPERKEKLASRHPRIGAD